MTHLFIINPAAGSKDRTAEYTQQIEAICGGQGLSYRIAVSQCPGDCTRIAREAAQSGQEYRIYACGGDGTLNEVVQGAAGYDNVAVTVFSGGSGNDFVKIFDDPQAFFHLERLLDAQETQFDLIDCNGNLCLNICSVGLDARIGLDVAQYKRIPWLQGFRAYAASTAINVIKGVSRHYVVQIEDETVDAPLTLLCVCNGRFYGGGFNPVPDADPTDGLLDVLLVKKVSRLQVAKVIGKYKNGQYAQLPTIVRHVRTRSLRVVCDEPTPIQLDGELCSSQVYDMRIADQKLRFFYPRGLCWSQPVAATV